MGADSRGFIGSGAEAIPGYPGLGGDVIRVSWDQVDQIGTAVRLKAKARDLGLGRGDDRQAKRIEELPRS